MLKCSVKLAFWEENFKVQLWFLYFFSFSKHRNHQTKFSYLTIINLRNRSDLSRAGIFQFQILQLSVQNLKNLLALKNIIGTQPSQVQRKQHGCRVLRSTRLTTSTTFFKLKICHQVSNGSSAALEYISGLSFPSSITPSLNIE